MAAPAIEVGGQALIEGVMMRSRQNWAVAIRKPLPEQLVDGELPAHVIPEGRIAVQLFAVDQTSSRFLKLPLVRGLAAIYNSLKIGAKAMRIATLAQTDQSILPPPGPVTWFAVVAIPLTFVFLLFFALPLGGSGLVGGFAGGGSFQPVIEGLIRLFLLFGYLLLIRKLPDVKRLLQYHGAEHMAVSCWESGKELNTQNASRFSTLHPRCGTSFALYAVIISFVFFAAFGHQSIETALLVRALGIPLILALTFEFQMLGARFSRNSLVKLLLAPGLQLQRLTTSVPDRSQLAVAIAALKVVVSAEPVSGRLATRSPSKALR